MQQFAPSDRTPTDAVVGGRAGGTVGHVSGPVAHVLLRVEHQLVGAHGLEGHAAGAVVVDLAVERVAEEAVGRTLELDLAGRQRRGRNWRCERVGVG